MKTKKYFVPKGREKFLSTVLNRDGLNHYFEETEGRSYVWVCLSCKEYRIMLEDPLSFYTSVLLGRHRHFRFRL